VSAAACRISRRFGQSWPFAAANRSPTLRKASYAIPASFSAQSKAILQAPIQARAGFDPNSAAVPAPSGTWDTP
jgi:hypothetical protein